VIDKTASSGMKSAAPGKETRGHQGKRHNPKEKEGRIEQSKKKIRGKGRSYREW